MKKIFLHTFTFILPLLLIAIVMEIMLRQIPNNYTFKKHYLDAHSEEVETLLLGSSHSYYGLNPTYFSGKTFNASYLDQYLNYDYEILKKYDDHWNKLKTVVIPISYFSIVGKLETSPESWRIKNYVLYYDMEVSNSIRDHSEILYSNLGRNFHRLISYYFKGESDITSSDLGWGSIYNSKNAKNLTETGIAAAKRHTVEEFDFLDDDLDDLKNIIEFCRGLSVEVVLFTPPASGPYIHNLNPQQLNITIKSARSIANTYDNCRYINLLDSDQFESTDFYDGDHLNEIGAKKLSFLIDSVTRSNNNPQVLTGKNNS